LYLQIHLETSELSRRLAGMERIPSRRAVVIAGLAASLASSVKAEGRMTHVALLGDSVIDNKAYVAGGLGVPEQLRLLVPQAWRVSMYALDGALITDVLQQLSAVPNDATHIVISVGGNDALQESGVLDASARSVGEALAKLAAIQDRFRRNYLRMLDEVGKRRVPTAICTIYDPRFPDDIRRRLSAVALSVLNDVISREAVARDLTLLDLRVMFDQEEDFANPIEPSASGGMKLARGIHTFLSSPQTKVIR
jgi:lysophospholipase L1-like esterase